MRSIRLPFLVLSLLLLLPAPAPAQTTGGYTAPAEFMNLFFDFTGSEEPDYPAGQPTLGQMLTQAVAARRQTAPVRWCWSSVPISMCITLPDDRIKIVPYAEVRPSLGQAQLAQADLTYYVQRVWGPLFYRTIVSDQVFAGIPTVYLPNRPPLPGDYFVTKADAIDQFMIRLKHSLRDAGEMLSNSVAFWMVQELANKYWNPAAVDIPGLTTGFPPGVAGYPAVTLK